MSVVVALPTANITVTEDPFVIAIVAWVGISIGGCCCLFCLCCNICFIWTRKLDYDENFKDRLWRRNPDSAEWVGELPPGFVSNKGMSKYVPRFMRRKRRDMAIEPTDGSATVTIAMLMSVHGLSLLEAWQRVKAARPRVRCAGSWSR